MPRGWPLPQSLMVTTPGAAFSITNGGGDGINGFATGTGRSGVYGVSSSFDGYGVDLPGQNTSNNNLSIWPRNVIRRCPMEN